LQSNLTLDQRIELSSMYRDNSTLFVQRMELALEQVTTNPLWENDVDVDNIAVIGYCMGGTGVIQLAFSGNNETKVVASFHGGHAGPDLPVATQNVTPYTLV
jgi:dienelactone hydrolase